MVTKSGLALLAALVTVVSLTASRPADAQYPYGYYPYYGYRPYHRPYYRPRYYRPPAYSYYYPPAAYYSPYARPSGPWWDYAQ
jgi:hypothetical protein